MHTMWIKDCQRPVSKGGDKLKYDGSIVFPEYGLVIDSPLASSGVVDVHGLGPEDGLKAVQHFVVGYDLAKQLGTADTSLNTFPTEGWDEWNNDWGTTKRTCYQGSLHHYTYDVKDSEAEYNAWVIDLIEIYDVKAFDKDNPGPAEHTPQTLE